MLIDFPGGARVDAHFGQFNVQTDQPPMGGGQGSAPTPFALFLASLGTCAGIYVKGFCDNRNIPAENIRIIQTTVWNKEIHLPASIKLEIKLPPDFPEKYKESLINVANLCLVKKSIANPPEFSIEASY